MGHSGDFKPITGLINYNQKVFISRLLNSVFYSIGTCFIVKLTTTDEAYRLLAIHRKKVLADRNYPTLRGARNKKSGQSKIKHRKLIKSLIREISSEEKKET